MPTNTTRLNIPKPLGNEYFNRTKFNEILDAIDSGAASLNEIGILTELETTEKANLVGSVNEVKQTVDEHKADDLQHVKYAAATGTANTYAVTFNPAPTAYVEGMAVAFKVPVASTAASTLNVNGLGAKGIKKANGTDVTNLKAGGIYTVRYDGTAFILQGEGASGNATASDLLSGKTATTDAGEITGTMPNRGTFNLPLGSSVPAGYYSGGVVPNGKKFASGSGTTDSSGFANVSGLSFTPTLLIVEAYYNNGQMNWLRMHAFLSPNTDFSYNDANINCSSILIEQNGSNVGARFQSGTYRTVMHTSGGKLQLGRTSQSFKYYAVEW